MLFNRKFSIAAALLALGTVCAGSAHAGNVQWSVGINLPPVGTVISNAPGYYAPAPVYYEPAPVYYEPAPVVMYRPAPRVVYRPVPVYAPRYYHGPGVIRSGWVVPSRGWGRDHRHDGRHDGHGDSRRGGRDDRGGRGDHGDRGSPEPRRQHH